MAHVDNITKAINLGQLDTELGGFGLNGPGLAALTDAAAPCFVVTVEGSPVTQDQLEAGVAAHVAVFPPTRDEMIDALPDPTKDLAAFKAGLKDLLG